MTQDDAARLTEAARDFIRAEAQALSAVATTVDEQFARVAALLYSRGGKIILAGAGTSGFMARRAAHILSVSGTPAVFIHPTEGMHGSVGAVQPDDLVIAISKGGGSDELNTFVTLAKHEGVPVVAITARSESPLAELADEVVVLPVDSEADPGGIIAMGSTLSHAAWLDALAYVLMRARGYGWDEVLFTHPGGAVGRLRDLPAPLEPLRVPGIEAI